MAPKYAIIRSGNKQYRVSSGDVIDVELLDTEKGGNIEFEEVLFIQGEKGGKVGTPTIAGTVVKGEVIDQIRGPKVIAYKYKRRKNYRRKIGHRQNYTRVKITEFSE